MPFFNHGSAGSGPSNLCIASNFAIGVVVGLVAARMTGGCPVHPKKKSTLKSKAGKLVLSYFDIPALGEPIRLLLEMGDFNWENNAIQFSDWQKLKPTTKWGQVPVLRTESGLELTQTKSLVRYLGKLVSVDGNKLYPDCPDTAFEADEMIDAFEDVRMKLVPSFAIKDQAEKEKFRQDLFKEGGECYALLMKIEKYAGEKYIVGQQYTVADLWCFWWMAFIKSGFFDGLGPDSLAPFTKLEKIAKNFGTVPAVKSYYKDNEKPAYKSFKY